MQGILETPGLTVAVHLVHGQVKVVPENTADQAGKQNPIILFGHK